MRTIRNIGLIFIVSVLIMATGGFSIYHHMCHCAGEMSASIFVETSCEPENTSASCCGVVETQSCCMEKPPGESKHACHDEEDCCSTSMQFLKISDSFQPGLEKISLKPFVLASALVFVFIPEDVHSIPTLNICNSDLPPPDTGRQILVALHQLKLDPNLV